jgi:hypothetical protein
MLTKIADWSSIVGAFLGSIGLLFSVLAFRSALEEIYDRARRQALKIEQKLELASTLLDRV